MVRSPRAGSAIWRVRVDLFAESEDHRRTLACVETLRCLLTDEEDYRVGGDQGTGATDRAVVGLSFWVRADDVGGAAVLALELARAAGVSHGVGPQLYEVAVIPLEAVASDDPDYPFMSY